MRADVRIEAARRGEVTYLKNSFFSPPFKVANITEDKTARELQLMLMSSSPGVLDGDECNLHIALADGCSLHLLTQSYQRLFTMKQGATQHMQVSMANGSSFCYLPHPSVPHVGSIFSATNRIDMADGCRLIWGEVLTCGRKLNGELFEFSTYHTMTEIVKNQRLVIRENLLIEPSTMNLNAIGQLEGFTHQASLIYLDELAPIDELIEKTAVWLARQPALRFGITTAPTSGLIVRILGQRGEQLHTCLKTMAHHLSQATDYPIKPAAYAP